MALPTGGHGVPDNPNVPYVLVHDDGLEICDTRPSQGIQVTPAELHPQVGLGAFPGPEKEAYESRATDLNFDKTPVLKSSIIPQKRQSWKLWLSIIAVSLLIVAIATAVSLGLHYSRNSRYKGIQNHLITKLLSLTMAILDPLPNPSSWLPMLRRPQPFQLLGHLMSPT